MAALSDPAPKLWPKLRAKELSEVLKIGAAAFSHHKARHSIMLRGGSSGAATQLAVRLLTDFWHRAVDHPSGLPWHAYESQGTSGFGVLGWTRGAGWLAIGLSETIAALPQDDPQRAELAGFLKVLVRAVKARQSPNGSWGWALSMPNCRSDTSGAAMLACAIETGARAGVLDSDDRLIAARALAFIAAQVTDRGLVTGALAECQGVGNHPREFGSYPYAQGFALAALAGYLENTQVTRAASLHTP